MRSGFSIVPLRRIARVQNGGTPGPHESNWEGDVPWATPVDLGRVHGGYLQATERSITATGLQSGSTLAPAGSVLISSRAPIGYAAIAGMDTAFNQGCKALIPLPGVSQPRFLKYAVESQMSTLQAAGRGSTFTEVSASDVASLPVPVTSLAKQDRIADYLDRETAEIDSLVKLWGELLTIVRERKQSFLDRIITSSTEQFTRVKHLLLRPISDGPHETPTFLDKGIPFLSVDGIQDGELIFEGCRYISEEDHLRYAKKIYPQKGDVLMGKAASTGKIALVRTEQEFNVWSPLAILRPNPSLVNGDWLTWALKATAAQVQIDLACTFNTQKNIAMSDIGDLEVPVPPLEEQLRLVNALDSFSRRSGEIEKEVNAAIGLAIERRAALISAAVTGQVDVTAQNVSTGEQLRDELEVHV